MDSLQANRKSFCERAEAVAASPDLVGLQEISVLRVRAPGSTGSSGVVMIDYLEVILDALAARGAHYAAVSTGNNWTAELPFLNVATGEINFASLSDDDVILARTDLPPAYLRLSNAAHGHFEYNLVIPELGLEFTRGWCSVDAFVRGRTFRFINTHLEQELFPELQWLQAQELLAGPANTPLPVVLVGDLNSDGNRQNGTFAYDGMLAAGFQDSWSAVHPGDAGLTWGHDGFLADPGVPFVWRIDLILYRGGTFEPQQAAVLDTPLSRDQPPFWSSDHAAVVGNLLLK